MLFPPTVSKAATTCRERLTFCRWSLPGSKWWKWGCSEPWLLLVVVCFWIWDGMTMSSWIHFILVSKSFTSQHPAARFPNLVDRIKQEELVPLILQLVQQPHQGGVSVSTYVWPSGFFAETQVHIYLSTVFTVNQIMATPCLSFIGTPWEAVASCVYRLRQESKHKERMKW